MGSRQGLTIIEVLVLIVVIGILLILIVPNSGCRPGRRIQCFSNIKNLGLAAYQHATSKNGFPGYLNDFGTFNMDSGAIAPGHSELSSKHLRSHQKIGTWAVSLLPWLEAQPTYEQWSEDCYPIVSWGERLDNVTPHGYLRLSAPNLAIFQCPSNPVADRDSGGTNSYICNAGMHHLGLAGEDEWTMVREDGTTTKINFERSMSVANGVFNNQVACVDQAGHPVPVGPKVTLDDFKDGLGNTMLFSENLQAQPWHHIGFGPVSNLAVDRSLLRYPTSARYVHGMVWQHRGNGETKVVFSVHRINGGLGQHSFVGPVFCHHEQGQRSEFSSAIVSSCWRRERCDG